MARLVTQKSLVILYITIRMGSILNNLAFTCICALILPSEMQIEPDYKSNVLRTY